MLDLVIIGAGMAGMTAAIYAARKRMDYAILSHDLGGQLWVSGEVVDYPGIVKTDGIQFARTMQEQLEFNKVSVKEGEEVVKIERITNGNFRVSTKNNIFETKTIIIATGSSPRELKIPGEQQLKNKGVHYCAICDGPLYDGKDVVVVGGGDSALEAVDFLDKIAKRIYLINVNEKLSAHEYLQERIANNHKVVILNKAVAKEIIGGKDGFVKSIIYEQEGKRKELAVQGIFVEIGRIPATGFAKGVVDIDEHEHIKVNIQTETSVPGIFAAGDCTSIHEYQYIIAAGQGCIALIKAARYLAGKK